MYYTRGDRKIVDSIQEELEAERTALQAGFDQAEAVDVAQAARIVALEGSMAALQEHIEHDVDFSEHVAPFGGPEVRTRGACNNMTAVCAYGTAAVFAPGATFDILTGPPAGPFVSILAAPVPPVGPGVITPIPIALPIVPAGNAIQYVWNDAGAPSSQVSMNAQWVKQV